MPSRKPFCAICGDIESPLHDGLCPTCYQKEHPLIQKKKLPEISLCQNCYSYQVEHKWIEVDSQRQSPEELISRASYEAVLRSYEFPPSVDIDLRIRIPPDLDEKLKTNRDFAIEGDLFLEGQSKPDLPEITTSEPIQIKIHPAICSKCL
jgi:NMD protein affecting ribosome stability and mRNA decay